MENIEHLKKNAKLKLLIMSLSTLLPILLLILLQVLAANFKEDSALPDLVVFRYGIFVLFEGYIGFKISVYIRILTNADFASNEVLKRNDERNKFIKLKTNAMSLKIFVYVIGIALIITAFLSRIAFYSLLSMLLVYLIIYLFVKLYYCKKY